MGVETKSQVEEAANALLDYLNERHEMSPAVHFDAIACAAGQMILSVTKREQRSVAVELMCSKIKTFVETVDTLTDN